MKNFSVANIAQLIDHIGAGVSQDNHDNPPVRIQIWDGRFIIGRYSNKKSDISTRSEIIMDDEKLELLIQWLLVKGVSFVAETGSNDAICIIEWSIEEE